MLSNHHLNNSKNNNNNNNHNHNIIVQSHQTDSHLEGITVSDTVFAARRQIFYKHGRSHSDETHTAVISSSISSASRKEKTASGLFSFFRWFKKEKEDDDNDDIGVPSEPSSPKFIRSHDSRCGSVDTLYSTATASSFAFVHPAYYRPFGSANQAEARITEGPETFTYRQRIRERDRRRELERDITLKKKYNLLGGSTIYLSADDVTNRHSEVNKSNESLPVKSAVNNSRNSTLSRKKRKAPPPPITEKKQNDYSLPSTLEHLNKTKSNNTSDLSKNNILHHRRTASESAKDKKAGAYCHVRGKRKAPPPPITQPTTDNPTNVSKSQITGQSNNSKKKRPAPPPPILIKSTDTQQIETTNSLSITNGSLEHNKENIESEKDRSRGSLSPEEKERLLKNIAKLQVVANRRNSLCTPPSSPNLGPKMAYSLCNDSLKLERGVLKSTKSEEGTSSSTSGNENKHAPPSPVSPRPWYKRHIMKDHSLNNNNKFFDKKKEKNKIEDWMPEVGVPRTSLINNDSNTGKFNIFGRAEKNEEKRKSQISMLVNISELDREAAEIVQKGHAKEKAILAAEDAKFYALPNEIIDPEINETYVTSPDVEIPKKSSAKELISLFNAITNVTRVTVNTSFFTKEGSSIFSREGKEKRFSFGSSSSSVSMTTDSSNVKKTEEKYSIVTEDTALDNDYKNDTLILAEQETYLESPGETRRRWNKTEIHDDDDNTKLNKLDLNLDLDNNSGSRVTIEEIDEFDVDVERSMKTQALYEANRLRRHHSPSPSIPTIAEQSESTSSVATTPGSTSNRSQSILTPTSPVKSFPPTISEIVSDLVPKQQPNKRPVSIWACPQCTLENPRWRLTCEACDMWKPPLHQNVETREIINVQRATDENKINNLNSNTETKENVSEDVSKDVGKNNKSGVDNGNTNKNTNINSVITVNNINTLKEQTTDQEDDKDKEMEKLRKARLAFFNKVATSVKESQQSEVNNKEGSSYNMSHTNTKECKNIEDEHAKLKEMLKDLKHSLPKRHKKTDTISDDTKVNLNNDKIDIKISENEKINKTEDIVPAVKNLGAIKKIPQNKANHTKSHKNTNNYNININEGTEKAEIYLVKTETIIEDIKIRKQQNDLDKPEKVSTSVQTSAMVRKAEPHMDLVKTNEQVVSKPPSGKVNSPIADKKEFSVPVTVEEYTIKDGVLYTSLSKERKTIGTGTFELILARDFAGIKATKTGKDSAKPPIHHVYANVPNSDIDNSANITNVKIEPRNELHIENDNAVEKLSVQLTQPSGLADFKAGLESEAAAAVLNKDKKDHAKQMVNTIAVNRLLRRLEIAIAKGQLKLAAKLAKELAQLKINCSVTRHKTADDILVDMYVEDKVSHQGPILLTVSPSFTVLQLKAKVEKEFEIPVAVQRWILGKQLAADDMSTLMELGINTPHCPIFLYLVAPDAGQERTSVVLPAGAADLDDELLATPLPPPPPENVKRGGWYYNDEDDKYSFCEETESELSEISDDNSKLDAQSLIYDNDDEDKNGSDYSENELNEENYEHPPTPPERNIEMERVQAPPTPTGTLALGWKCELCTLVNSPTRPGCAACTNPRPQNYHVPQEYQLSQHEIERIRDEELKEQETAAERLQNYQALVDLENADVVLNTEEFECPICFLACVPRDGVILRDCLHSFCRACLINTVQFNEEAEVKCPYRDTKYACDSALLEREIKALVPPDVYEQHLAKSVAEAENKIGNAFHCKTPDCPGWCIFEDNVNEFLCPVCRHTNCLTCQAIHAGINCKQFQERARQDSETNADARRTNEMLEEMVDRGEAMKCPTCQVILMKKWGCDWLRCSMCKTEICWVTRGPRWGPLGKGDTTGGCQCGVNGIKCHPKCNYCH